MTTQTTVHYYDPTCTRIVRTRTYMSRQLADAAMARARKRWQASAIAGTRTAADQPTTHR